jgi:hypothetical protein
LFFSCYGSVAAPRQRPGRHDEVPAKHNGHRPRHHAELPATHNERRRGQRPGETIKYLQRTTSAFAGNGLGAMNKYLQRTTSGAAGNDRA